MGVFRSCSGACPLVRWGETLYVCGPINWNAAWEREDDDENDDRDKDNAAAQYLLLNQIAYNEALYLSDRIWIDDEGHRTPLVTLGSFPGEGGATQEIDADSYLN